MYFDFILFKSKIKEGNFLISPFSHIITTMGEQYEGVIFDPRDINFNIGSVLEYKHRGFIYKLKYNHRCFHDIDRKEVPTVILNSLEFIINIDEIENFYYSRFFDVSLELTYYPYWRDIYYYIQYNHDIKFDMGIKFDLILYKKRFFSFNLIGDYYKYFPSELDSNNYYKKQIKLEVKYRKEGFIGVYFGYLDDRYFVKPKGERFVLGIDGGF